MSQAGGAHSVNGSVFTTGGSATSLSATGAGVRDANGDKGEDITADIRPGHRVLDFGTGTAATFLG
jgi:hypothetical protein